LLPSPLCSRFNRLNKILIEARKLRFMRGSPGRTEKLISRANPGKRVRCMRNLQSLLLQGFTLSWFHGWDVVKSVRTLPGRWLKSAPSRATGLGSGSAHTISMF